MEVGPLTLDLPLLSAVERVLVRPYSKFGRLRTRIPGTRLRVATSIEEATSPGTVLVGFFQDSRSLEHSVEMVLGRLAAANVPESLPAKRIAEGVAVHVRRGDYVSLPSSIQVFGTTSRDYYFRGIEALGARPSEVIYFTDDPSWVVENMQASAEQVVTSAEIPSPLQTMLTMGLAPKLVMPNSTFSWWAAEMVTLRAGQVAGPATWFFDREDAKSLVRPDWIQIDNG